MKNHKYKKRLLFKAASILSLTYCNVTIHNLFVNPEEDYYFPYRLYHRLSTGCVRSDYHSAGFAPPLHRIPDLVVIMILH